jgi:hypothetical protein
VSSASTQSITDYQNSDLLIDSSPTGYRTVVTRSPAREASATFVLPFSEEERLAKDNDDSFRMRFSRILSLVAAP